jgi:hypothetical protein
MKLLDKTMVNLSSNTRPNLLGHISLYKKTNGNLYYVYFVEAVYYAAKEVDFKTKKILKEETSDNDYHYNIDIFFNDKDRYLGWEEMFGGDFMTESYKPILRAKV